jgi:hypothetical protein
MASGVFGQGGSWNAQAFGGFGAAATDLGAYYGTKAKAAGDIAEAGEYSLAAQLAQQNAQFTVQSTQIKEAQQQREITQAIGKTTAQFGGAGFAESGSALDILRESASQGALTKAVTSEQGLITEEGYKEQAASYNLMATAANNAAHAEGTAGTFDLIAGGISALSGFAAIA